MSYEVTVVCFPSSVRTYSRDCPSEEEYTPRAMRSIAGVVGCIRSIEVQEASERVAVASILRSVFIIVRRVSRWFLCLPFFRGVVAKFFASNLFH